MMQTFVNVTANLMGGFRETLILFFYTLAFSLPLGLVIAFGSMSGWAPLRLLTRAFVWVIRGTPLMLQLIIVYYGPASCGIWPSGAICRWAIHLVCG
jgi:polar amino acid transport system permease protein